MDGIQALLVTELERRRRDNPRYSVRSFARSLELDHSTVSQLLRGRRRAGSRTAAHLRKRLAEDVDQRLVRRLVETGANEPDSRWLADRLGMSVDAVNLALAQLLARGVLVMEGERWTIRSSPGS
jgi:hypothetical protein